MNIEIDWNKISKNQEVIALIKQIIVIEDKIRLLDEKALINYQLEILQL